MEQTIEGVQSASDDHTAANSGHNNIQPLSNGSVSKEDENALNQHTPRDVDKTSPRGGLGHTDELTTTRDDVTGVVNSSQDDQLAVTVSSPAKMSNKTGPSDDIFKEDIDQSDMNHVVFDGLNNTSAFTSNHLHNHALEQDSASYEKHYVDKSEAIDMVGEVIESSNIVEDREQLDQDRCSSIASGAFVLTRSKKVIDVPSNILECSKEFCKEELSRSVASTLSALHNATEIVSRKQAEDSEVSDEDVNSKSYVSRLSAKHNVLETLTKPQEDDCETPDDGELRDEKLGGATSMPREISAENCGTCYRDDTNIKDVSASTESKVVGTGNQIRDENTRKAGEETSSRSTRSGNGTCGVVKSETPATGCERLDQETVITEDDCKVTVPSIYTDMPSERPKQVVDMFSSKVRKNIVPKFKELDTATTSDNCFKPPSENSTDAPHKSFSSGRKYGGVSLIINKYNTLLDSAVPACDKDKYKPKSAKLTHSKDTSSCIKCAQEELDVACHESTNEDAPRDDAHVRCDKTKDAQESNQEGDTVFNDPRTGIYVDCLHTTRHKNTCEDGEKTNPSTIEDDETCECCVTNRHCGDIFLAVVGNPEIENKNITCGNGVVNKPKRFNPLVEDVQENKLPDKSSRTAAEERNIIEPPSESNSIWVGSMVDSIDEPFAIDTNENIDADDEFSSVEEYKGLTPRSPISADENETLYQTGVVCRDEMGGHIVKTKCHILEDSCTKDNGKDESHGKCFRKDETVPLSTSGDLVLNTCQIYNDGISLPSQSLKGNYIKVFRDNSSQAASHTDEQTIEPFTKSVNSLDQLVVEDKEFIYLDAESGDLNEQSEASWEQLVSCCNSGNQSCSEMQECIQLFANEDMKSIESGSIYDDVASGSHLDYSNVKNISDRRNLKCVSSYCSENESCSNFYSEEGDHKQSDNQDGYLSALDVGEDPAIFRSTESLEHFDRANDSNVSGQDVNPNDDNISVNYKQGEYTTRSTFSPEREECMKYMHEESSTGDALDVGKDSGIFRSTEHLEHFDIANGSNGSGQDVNPNDNNMSVNYKQGEYTTRSTFSPEREKFIECIHEESSTGDALDVGKDSDIFRSTEHLEHFDIANGSNGSGQDVNPNDDNMSVNYKRGECTTGSTFSPEGEECMKYMHEESSTGHDNTDFVEVIRDTNNTELTEEENENVTTKFDTNEYAEQVDLFNREDITSRTSVNSSIGSLDEETDIEAKNVVPPAEDTAATVSEKETFTNERSDSFPSGRRRRSKGTDDKEGSTNQTCLIYMVEQIATHKDDSGKEVNALNESIVANEINDQEIANITATKRTIHNGMSDYVDSKVLLNLNTGCNADNLLTEEFHFSEDISVDNATGSGSMEEDLEDVFSEQLSTHEASQEDTTNEDDSEALASDGEDEETKDACCKEFQVIRKRMKKLKKTMESLNDQVSREKCYLEQEVEKYKNMPELVHGRDLSLFEKKLAEVQRERWLGQQPAHITQEEYWRRLKEADQMCGEEIEQMNVAEEKLRHLTRITDVWMRTNVVLPYYDPPSLELVVPEAEDSPEVTQRKVDELATEVVDMIGTSDAYMTSWLINEADRMKANYYPVTGNTTSNFQNFNDLSVDHMLLPPHLLEKLQVLRDVVKANSLPAEITQNTNQSDDQKAFLSNLTESQDLHLNQSLELENQTLVSEKIDSNS